MKYVDLPPYAPILMESTRAIGYSLEAAIADIIDNSIAASAANVWVDFLPGTAPFITILDDGMGMNSESLTQAMQYGSKSPNDIRADNDLGRFGLGLKTASLSQCKRLTVASKTVDEKIEARRWDLDYIMESESWSLGVLSAEEIANLPNIDKLNKLKSGTLIVWQTLDRMAMGGITLEDTMSGKMGEVRKHLSLVFHRYLSGERDINKIQIFMNDNILLPIDPFFEGRSYEPFEEEKYKINGQKSQAIRIKPYILPHISKLDPKEILDLGGKDGLRKRQGFYIYRNKRLLVGGTWFRMLNKGELSKLARVRVDIPNSLDDLWSLDIKKSTAIPPETIKKALKSTVEKIAEYSKRTWTYRGKKETSENIIHIWCRNITRDGSYYYTINKGHPDVKKICNDYPKIDEALSMLIEHIERYLPVNDIHESSVNDVKIENEQPEDFQNVLRGLLLLVKNDNDSKKAKHIEELKKIEPFAYYCKEIDEYLKKKE